METYHFFFKAEITQRTVIRISEIVSKANHAAHYFAVYVDPGCVTQERGL